MDRFQEGLAPINLVVEDSIHRAMPGGTGGVKTITNYAPVNKRYHIHYFRPKIL